MDLFYIAYFISYLILGDPKFDFDLEKHIVVFYALPMDSITYTGCVWSWYKIFIGPCITDMSLYLYPTASD